VSVTSRLGMGKTVYAGIGHLLLTFSFPFIAGRRLPVLDNGGVGGGGGLKADTSTAVVSLHHRLNMELDL
jgi:hypothetical protein